MGLNFFQKNKRMILAVVLIGLIAAPLALVPVEMVRAQNPYAVNPNPYPDAKGAGWSWLGVVANYFGSWYAFLMNVIIIPIAAGILALVGNLLDFAIDYSLNTSHFKMPVIDIGWKLIRDLINMGFIFILIYIAISTILQLSSYNIKSMLTKLIIAAVLINFSLFFTRVVIDAGNIVAVNFYNSFSAGTDGKPSISTSFKNYLKIQDQYVNINTGKSTKLEGVAAWQDSILRLIVIGVALYVFLSVALLFVARTVAFIFLMITSPIGFIGAIFPGASGAAKEWRETLFHQTLVAPVFIILIYLVAQILNANIFQVDPDKFGLSADSYFNYIIIIAFLLFTKNITKKLSGKAGAMINDFGKKALAVAAGATLAAVTGGAALAGRAVIGRGAAMLASSGGLKDMAAQKGIRGLVGRTTLRASDKVAKSSFEARNVGMFQKAAGFAGVGVKKTKTGEGGIVGVQERKTEKARELAEKLAPTKSEEQQKRESYAAAQRKKNDLEKQAVENIKKSGAPGSVELHKQSEMIRLAGGPDKFNQMNQEVAKRKAEFDFVDTSGGKVSEREKQYAQQLKQPGVAGGGPTAGAERGIGNAADTLSEKIKEAMTEAGGDAADKMAKAMGVGVGDLKKKLDDAMATLNKVRPGAIDNPELRNSISDDLNSQIQSLAPAFSAISNESAQQVSQSVAQIKQNLANIKQPGAKEYIIQKVAWTPQWKREAAEKIEIGEKLKKKKGGKDKKKFLEEMAEMLGEEMPSPTPSPKPPAPPPTTT